MQKNFRLNANLLIYPSSIEGVRQIIAEVSALTPPLVIHQPDMLWALTVLPEIFSQTEAKKKWSERSALAPFVLLIWENLIQAEIIIKISSSSNWDEYGWQEARSYHQTTRNYPFLKMDDPSSLDAEFNIMTNYVAEAPPPPIFQSISSVFQYPLPKALALDESPRQVLTAMSSYERRGLMGLGFLLDYCFGVRKVVRFEVQGDFLRKSVPSGGARHPTETFYVSLCDSIVMKGVYHYNVENHRLDCVQFGDFSQIAKDASFDLFEKFNVPPVGLLIFTVIVERAMWRYRDPRPARVPFVDVGHAVAQARLIADMLGFDFYTYQKISRCEDFRNDRSKWVEPASGVHRGISMNQDTLCVPPRFCSPIRVCGARLWQTLSVEVVLVVLNRRSQKLFFLY
ncbi:MAG: SagB/ThcOx family dehydrogenase [Burkholderiaceae bacterium]|nr:SagB/ThcOx family dehydrogenase [Burkholderiaceae bacterium]